MSGWQPIETAPKDGTVIILFQPGEYGGFYFLQWKKEQNWMNGQPVGTPWYGWAAPHDRVDDEFNAYFKPSHWMPAPDQPC